MKTWLERITKAKRPETVVNKIVARIDELAPELKRLKALQDEMADMKAALEHHATDEYEETSEVGFFGDKFEITFSPVQIVRKVKNVKGILKALGEARFLECVNVSLERLDKEMPKDEQKKYVSSRRIGTRACRIKPLNEKK